ncbi:hypothetical protein LCGC14_2307860, partial [marine sediment metagenome]
KRLTMDNELFDLKLCRSCRFDPNPDADLCDACDAFHPPLEIAKVIDTHSGAVYIVFQEVE